MREIKFRAWDKYHSRWIDLHSIRFNKDGSIIGVWDIQDNLYGLHQIELVQYTGLKDNTKWEQLTQEEQGEWLARGETKYTWKGKEIYERDIVRLYGSIATDDPAYGIYEPIYAVMWQSEGSIGWCIEEEIGNKYKRLGLHDSDKVEVIGNIWENKELLNESK